MEIIRWVTAGNVLASVKYSLHLSWSRSYQRQEGVKEPVQNTVLSLQDCK